MFLIKCALPVRGTVIVIVVIGVDWNLHLVSHHQIQMQQITSEVTADVKLVVSGYWGGEDAALVVVAAADIGHDVVIDNCSTAKFHLVWTTSYRCSKEDMLLYILKLTF